MTRCPHALAGALIAVAALLAGPSPLHAQGAGPAACIDRARSCLAALDFACAEAELAAARDDVAGLPDDVKVQLLALSAQTALATGRQADGARHLRALLDLAPAFEPAPGAWPASWHAELARAREAMPDRAAPDVELERPADATAGSPCRVTARVSDRSGVGEVALVVAREAGGEPVRVPMTTTDGRTWSAEVPAPVLLPPGIAFAVEAFDLKGNGPARAPAGGGLARVPVRPAPPPPPPPPPPKPPLVRQWWLWTIVGGVVVAGAATTAYFLWPRDSGNGSSAPGPGHVNVGFEWSSR